MHHQPPGWEAWLCNLALWREGEKSALSDEEDDNVSECNDTNDDGNGDISEEKPNVNPDAAGPRSLPPVLPMLLLH